MPGKGEPEVDLLLRNEVAQLIIDTLDLEDIAAEDIEPEAPLFGDGLCLDSIDALEISFVIAQQFGIKLRSDDEDIEKIFGSLNSLTQFIAEMKKI